MLSCRQDQTRPNDQGYKDDQYDQDDQDDQEGQDYQDDQEGQDYQGDQMIKMIKK